MDRGFIISACVRCGAIALLTAQTIKLHASGLWVSRLEHAIVLLVLESSVTSEAVV